VDGKQKKVMPAITEEIGTGCRSFRRYLSDISGRSKSRNCWKQPYWVLRKELMWSTNNSTWEITWIVTTIVTTEQLQHYIHY